MDVLYGNLDNYNEERTIAELRSENKDLKVQLEGYSASLNKLQKNILQEFDKLTAEHNKLEVNYSSLLKTARAEIERKTAIIVKLNVEKDAMVLKSIQNKNTPRNRRNASKNKKTTNNKEEPNVEIAGKCSPLDGAGNRNKSHERITNASAPSENTHSSNISTRLLDIANSVTGNTDIIPRNFETKENIGLKDEETKPRASIRNRRKSMPAFSKEPVKLITDDDDDVGSAKNNFISREYSDRNHRGTIPKSNSEDRMSGHCESREIEQCRHSKQSEGKTRDRNDHSQRYKRNESTDRIRQKSRDNSVENRQRHEYDRRKRRIDTPPNEFQNHRSRDSLRSYERNNSHEIHRHQSRSQEKYMNKHKIIHEHEEPCNKRMRRDLHRPEEERRRNEKQGAAIDRHEMRTDLKKLEEERLRIERQLAPIDRRVTRRDSHKHEADRLRNERQLAPTERHEIRTDLHRHEEERLRNERQGALIVEKHELRTNSHRHEEERLRNERQGALIVERHELRRESHRREEEKVRIERHEMRTDSQRHEDERLRKERQGAQTEVYDMRTDLHIREEERSNAKQRGQFERETDLHRLEEDTWWQEKQGAQIERHEPLQHLHDTSCQSPDYIHSDSPPSNQTREIKFNSSTNLEDPRISSKKYILNTRNGRSELLTVESAKIDVKVIDTSGWDKIKQVKMPDALIQRPGNKVEFPDDRTDTDMNRIGTSDWDMIEEVNYSHDIQNSSGATAKIVNDPNEFEKSDGFPENKVKPSSEINKPEFTEDVIKNIYDDMYNISMEAEEVNDLEDVQSHSKMEYNTKETCQEQSIKCAVEQKSEYSSQKLGDYKIPKKSDNTKLNKINKEMLCADELKVANKHSGRTKSCARVNDVIAQTEEKLALEPSVNNMEIMQSRVGCISSQFDNQNQITGKHIIEDDLELSDENSDMADAQITKHTKSSGKQDLRKKKCSLEPRLGIYKNNNTEPEELDQPNIAFHETEIHGDIKKSMEQNQTMNETNIEDITDDNGRKSKAKNKSLKLKSTKDPIENTNSHPTTDMPVKKRENKAKGLNVNAHALAMEKPGKKKEITLIDSDIASSKEKPDKKKDRESKTIEPVEKTDTASSTEKPVQRKISKVKELFANREYASSTEKAVKKKEKELQIKVTFANTEPATTIAQPIDKKDVKIPCAKFSELFGDTTSSLISPEDLGLVPVPAPVQPPHNYLPIFEDAQDAIDLNAIRTRHVSIPMENANGVICNAEDNNAKTIENTSVNTNFTQHKSENNNATETAPTDNTYQNLQPENSPEEKDIVKTVIISSGSQQNTLSDSTGPNKLDNDKEIDFHIMQCVKPTVNQHILMQALATSTPLKYWQQNVVAGGTDLKIASGSIESRDSDKVTAGDNSDQNTIDSQTNNADEPDVRIILKRKRRKVKK